MYASFDKFSKKKTTKKEKWKKKRKSNEKSTKIIQITEILFDLIKFR